MPVGPSASHRARLLLPLLLAGLLLLPATSVGHLGGAPGSGGPYEPPAPSEAFKMPRSEQPCPNDHPEWRKAQVVEGVEIQESLQCRPDNPELVAAFVKGTNNVPQEMLDKNALHEDAVVKGRDLDGDGDPDEINITLEVAELNGWHLPDDDLAETYDIAPGIHPSFWVFTPKTTIDHTGPTFFDLARMPSPPIRVEVGDTVRLTVENTHYFPHTVHLHGVDHPFLTVEGEGNDGVPHISEAPILPGEERTYTLKARQAGSMFYHCHVQPHVHVMMGLGALFVVEEDREDNWIQTLNPGGGHVRHPSKAVRETYDREYDLIYQDFDKELGEIPKSTNDPREIARLTNRVYDATERDSDYFLLNGKSFPYTLRESVVVVG
ncbi:MAG: multicopper oxidase domain-containing protein, partial [Candidatus Thermoplasmatota archaeon]|nr:multicopper oxidase domain-containing protein [Candidatus Thermoplasmatota archaeon]